MRQPWQRYTQHPFVEAIGKGELPVESFKGYLIQDYLYLVCPAASTPASGADFWPADLAAQTHFARANALSSYKSTTMQGITNVRHCKCPHQIPSEG